MFFVKIPRVVMMERPIIRNLRTQTWLVVLASFVLWFPLIYLFCSASLIGQIPVSLFSDNSFGNSVILPLNSNQSAGFFDVGRRSHLVREETEDLTQEKNGGEIKQVEDGKLNWGFSDQTEDFNKTLKEENGQEREEIENRNPNLVLKEKTGDFTAELKKKNGEPNRNRSDSSCSGKYIYIHEIPKKFNEDLIKKCGSLSNWTNMCEFTANSGLGPHLINFERVYSNTGWFSTNQFSLEVIFHNKVKNYKCLTNNSSLASAIFVPYYAGLDVSRYLWGSNTSNRDSASLELVKWLREKPEWKAMWGRDHFVVAGRITWDFRRVTDEQFDWGNKFLDLPESKNMSILTIESSPWHNNDFAIPYPTYFHPSSENEVFQWQNRMRRQKRRSLFSFAGSPRPNIQDSIRDEIIGQCRASRRKCRLIECNSKGNRCYKPDYVMKMFQSSVFCLQPPGDSYTRRSAFDSILAGCIPVFFHPGSAYVQYLWHLPKDHTKYSMFIPASDVKDGKVSIEKKLLEIPKKKVVEMREEVIKLIPKVVYGNPRHRLETLEDAFDITIKSVIERVERIRKEMGEGKNSSFAFPEELSWKYNSFGTLENHQWDPFFAKY